MQCLVVNNTDLLNYELKTAMISAQADVFFFKVVVVYLNLNLIGHSPGYCL